MDGAGEVRAPMPVLERPLEGLVEVRARGALGPGAGEHVAGAALRHEQLLARDEVGVVGLGAAPSTRSAPARRPPPRAPRTRPAGRGWRALDPSARDSISGHGRQLRQAALRRGDDPARPRPPTRSAACAWPRARRAWRAQLVRRLQPGASRARRSRAPRRRRSGRRASRAPAAGTAAASIALTSAAPECPAETGSTPQAAASAATIP